MFLLSSIRWWHRAFLLNFQKELRQNNDRNCMGTVLLIDLIRSCNKFPILNDRSHPLKVIRSPPPRNDFANHMSRNGDWPNLQLIRWLLIWVIVTELYQFLIATNGEKLGFAIIYMDSLTSVANNHNIHDTKTHSLIVKKNSNNF